MHYISKNCGNRSILPRKHSHYTRGTGRTAGKQQVTRVPCYRPGEWVVLKDDQILTEFSGTAQQIGGLYCGLFGKETSVKWEVCFKDADLPLDAIARYAIEDEIAAAKKRNRPGQEVRCVEAV